MFPHMTMGPKQHSWYSNLIWAGRFRVWTLLEARFYAPVQTGVGAHSLLYNGTGPLSRAQQPACAIDNLHHRTPKKEELEPCHLGHVRGSPPMLSQVFSYPRTETTNTKVEVILSRDPLLAHYRTLLFQQPRLNVRGIAWSVTAIMGGGWCVCSTWLKGGEKRKVGVIDVELRDLFPLSHFSHRGSNICLWEYINTMFVLVAGGGESCVLTYHIFIILARFRRRFYMAALGWLWKEWWVKFRRSW
jgi:hypothetical protein